MMRRAMHTTATVIALETTIALPTYLPAVPTRIRCSWKNGSIRAAAARYIRCPSPTASRTKPVDRKWKAVWLENEYLRVMILPEIGGRIHAVRTRPTATISSIARTSSSPRWWGWPGHGFPAASNSTGRSTTAPRRSCRSMLRSKSTRTARKRFGAATTIPMARMKGMHGVCLHPGKAMSN